MPVGLSPTWQVKTGLGSLETCNTNWNAKAIHHTVVGNQSFSTSPAWIPIFPAAAGADLDVTSDSPYAFVRMLVPGFIHRVMLRIQSNGLSSGFRVYLARDGPVNGGGVGDGTPIKERLIFNIFEKTEPEYNELNKFPSGTPDDTVIPLFGGHSYGYVIETDGDVVPTGNVKFNIFTSVYYGGAGS